VAALAFGPKKVIIIIGKNKITENIDDALHRIKTIACPKNVKRLQDRPKVNSVEKMWCTTSIIERQINPNRIHVIIVNEELGY